MKKSIDIVANNNNTTINGPTNSEINNKAENNH